MPAGAMRPRGNTLVLLFIFFLIGLFLHYGGRTQPVVAFWNDFRQMIGLGRSRSMTGRKTIPTKRRNPDARPRPGKAGKNTPVQ